MPTPTPIVVVSLRPFFEPDSGCDGTVGAGIEGVGSVGDDGVGNEGDGTVGSDGEGMEGAGTVA
jgi:hypothetical protein